MTSSGRIWWSWTNSLLWSWKNWVRLMMTGPSWAQSAPDHQFGPAFFLAKCGNPQLVDKRLVVVLDQFFFRFLPFAGVHVRNDVLILCNQVYSFPLKQLFHNMNNLQEHNLEYQLIFLVPWFLGVLTNHGNMYGSDTLIPSQESVMSEIFSFSHKLQTNITMTRQNH